MIHDLTREKYYLAALAITQVVRSLWRRTENGHFFVKLALRRSRHCLSLAGGCLFGERTMPSPCDYQTPAT